MMEPLLCLLGMWSLVSAWVQNIRLACLNSRAAIVNYGGMYVGCSVGSKLEAEVSRSECCV